MSKAICLSVRISPEAMKELNRLQVEFSKRLNTKFSRNKIVDVLLRSCANMTFADIVNRTKEQ